MNSVSMPSRPPWRASSASSETTAGEKVVVMLPDPTPLVAAMAWARTDGRAGVRRARRLRLLVRPVAVAREELARLILLVALAVAAHADPEEQVEQQDRQPGADDVRRALEPVHGGIEGP